MGAMHIWIYIIFLEHVACTIAWIMSFNHGKIIGKKDGIKAN